MNRIFSLLSGCLLFTSISNAQYTNVINSNKPGNTETPYGVGTNVFQFENKIHLSSNKQNNIKTKSIGNDFNFRYGFWKEQLEASFIHEFRTSDINGTNDTGTEVLALGLKYMLFDYKQKETPDLTRSWKKRNSFTRKGLIPTVALSVHYNTPLNNTSFNNSGSSFSTAIITQNHISKKLRVNNQFEYKYIGSNLPEFIYSLSGSYVLFNRFNPYTEFRLHQLNPSGADSYNYYSAGVGVPFLIHKNLSVAVNYNYNFGKVRGSEIGLHASYRIDKHKDKWIKVKNKKEDSDADEVIEYEYEKPKKEFKKEAFLDEIVDTKKQERAKRKAEKEEEKRRKKEEKLKKKKEEVDDVLLTY